MPPYKKPNNGREKRRRSKWGGKQRSHPANSGNLRSNVNHPHHRVHREKTSCTWLRRLRHWSPTSATT